VTGESPGGTKYRKAQQLEVTMIDEVQLLGMIGVGDKAGQLGLPLDTGVS